MRKECGHVKPDPAPPASPDQLTNCKQSSDMNKESLTDQRLDDEIENHPIGAMRRGTFVADLTCPCEKDSDTGACKPDRTMTFKEHFEAARKNPAFHEEENAQLKPDKRTPVDDGGPLHKRVPSRDCKHGRPARSCEIYDLERQVEEQRQRAETAERLQLENFIAHTKEADQLKGDLATVTALHIGATEAQLRAEADLATAQASEKRLREAVIAANEFLEVFCKTGGVTTKDMPVFVALCMRIRDAVALAHGKDKEGA